MNKFTIEFVCTNGSAYEFSGFESKQKSTEDVAKSVVEHPYISHTLADGTTAVINMKHVRFFTVKEES